LDDRAVVFDRTCLIKLFKITFDGFKTKARADQDPVRAEKYGGTKKTGRRRQRRMTTYNNRRKAALAYEEQHGLNPLEVIDLEFVSDYASGPETDAEESFDEWKVRMGAELGMSESSMGTEAWQRTSFLEYIRPRWRSEQVSISCALEMSMSGLTSVSAHSCQP
jgi:hypothetical protein